MTKWLLSESISTFNLRVSVSSRLLCNWWLLASSVLTCKFSLVLLSSFSKKSIWASYFLVLSIFYASKAKVLFLNSSIYKFFYNSTFSLLVRWSLISNLRCLISSSKLALIVLCWAILMSISLFLCTKSYLSFSISASKNEIYLRCWSENSAWAELALFKASVASS